ncbi:MAG: hypothetical protein AAFZ91_04550 [Pseudomonadota bacterium]
MNIKMKLVGLLAAVCLTTPIASAANETTMQVAFEYDRSAPVDESYNKAKRTAEHACDFHVRVAPLRPSIQRECVAPMLSQFVTKTGDLELIAYHEARIGEAIQRTHFVAR